MKTKQLLFFSAVFPTFAALSQPIINLSDLTPSVGDSFTLTTAAFIEPGQGGANQVWDYSELEDFDSNSMTFQSPENKPGSDLFPNATHLSVSDDGTIFKYSYYGESRLDRLGIVMPSDDLQAVYVNPFLELQFPFTMNDSFVDDWIFETKIGSNNVTQQTGTSTITVDGYGTLLLPTGNYADVLRVKNAIESEIVITLDGIEIFRGPWIENSYTFFKAGIPNPLLSMRTTIFNGQTIRTGDYLSNLVLAISDVNSESAKMNIFPNPANDFVEIAFQTDQYSQVAATLFSMDGQPVHYWGVQNITSGKNKLHFDLPNVSEGIYLLKLNTATETLTEKIVIHH
ncbi:T9SS type A sorting domain-containing protein [Aequorivita sp. SDUM287046]|uniref:T9SS type A sorting domain-containing protein n=1 Tax=Aequorivita aurantiaca TaxID=3053356 RepID=A0ABT8DFK2_9FLAO|nr:T9SS type A sorting domain-containing protein [Aequorivita aurantiaca]MDN3724125.1 T9SS type A sorting domain-containing protein [Aequorivita aurantiaca]